MLLGTMDAHQMSDLLRWDEYEAITRCLANSSGPSWAYKLMLSFYVAVTEDCAERHRTILRDCLYESKVFGDEEIDHIVVSTSRVAVRRDYRWVNTPGRGWVAEGGDAFSMRETGGSFNFTAFRDFMAAVSEAC
jgi:hypothetical protein